MVEQPHQEEHKDTAAANKQNEVFISLQQNIQNLGLCASDPDTAMLSNPAALQRQQSTEDREPYSNSLQKGSDSSPLFRRLAVTKLADEKDHIALFQVDRAGNITYKPNGGLTSDRTPFLQWDVKPDNTAALRRILIDFDPELTAHQERLANIAAASEEKERLRSKTKTHEQATHYRQTLFNANISEANRASRSREPQLQEYYLNGITSKLKCNRTLNACKAVPMDKQPTAFIIFTATETEIQAIMTDKQYQDLCQKATKLLDPHYNGAGLKPAHNCNYPGTENLFHAKSALQGLRLAVRRIHSTDKQHTLYIAGPPQIVKHGDNLQLNKSSFKAIANTVVVEQSEELGCFLPDVAAHRSPLKPRN